MKKIIIKWKDFIILLCFLVCFFVFCISIFKIVKWKFDSNKTNENINNINEIVEVEEIVDSENTEVIEQEIVDKSNSYWDYIKMNLINVNFAELKKVNSNTVGWIQVNGTNINYPFVQADNNDYYLNHSFDKKYNSAGWVFLDYRNNINKMNKNTIIYAHGRRDNTMFGTLKKIITNGWLENTNNYVIKLSTEAENTLWQVFSVYRIPVTSDYLKINFNTNEEFERFAQMLKNRSSYDFKTNVSGDDKIITLSTCYDDDRVVLHAKLIKKEKR